MKNSYKPRRLIDCYRMKKQIHGGYKVIEYSHLSNGSGGKKRTLYKDLSLTDAEDKLYRLENKYLKNPTR